MNSTSNQNTNNTQSPTIDWEQAITDHEQWLRTVILARVGEAQAVDEVLQEVFLAIAKGKNHPTNPEKVAPWLYRVAVLQSLLYRRKAGRRRKLVDRFSQRMTTSDYQENHQPVQWMLADERKVLVRNALSQLSQRDKEILLLKYTEDWSYQQISDHLGISVSAVEARLHRARKRMRDQITAMESQEVEA